MYIKGTNLFSSKSQTQQVVWRQQLPTMVLLLIANVTLMFHCCIKNDNDDKEVQKKLQNKQQKTISKPKLGLV